MQCSCLCTFSILRPADGGTTDGKRVQAPSRVRRGNRCPPWRTSESEFAKVQAQRLTSDTPTRLDRPEVQFVTGDADRISDEEGDEHDDEQVVEDPCHDAIQEQVQELSDVHSDSPFSLGKEERAVML